MTDGGGANKWHARWGSFGKATTRAGALNHLIVRACDRVVPSDPDRGQRCCA